MPIPHRIATAGLLWAALVLAPQALRAADAPAQAWDLGAALQQAASVSGGVRSAQLEVQARTLQAQALAPLGGPSVGLAGLTGRASTTVSVDTSGLAAVLNPGVAFVDGFLPGALAPVPSSVTATRQTNFSTAGVMAAWPIYVGGRVAGLKAVATGRTHEAEAEYSEREEDLVVQLAQRYFGSQLAHQALALRQAATAGIAEHLRAAQTLEARGLIARAERLRADVALDLARRDEARAANDVQLAELALRRLLAQDMPVLASTPLFVHSTSPGSLQSYLDEGQAHHPAWAKLAAKREQADGALQALGQPGLPSLVALANYGVAKSQDVAIKPSWQVGLALNWTLWGQVDRSKLREAARLEQQRVDASAEQARRDIPTLVEAQWRAAENARLQYLAGASGIALAEENLKLQRVAFAQAQATSVDVTDAQLALAKSQVERLQAAYDYDLALARLLAASGQAHRLPELAAGADLRLDEPASLTR